MKLIDADAYLESIKPYGISEEVWKESEAFKSVNRMQTVDAVPLRRGRWKEDKGGYGFWICSYCNFVSEASGANILYKFCPNCGARNIKGDDET